jgi:dTDP-4-dehydrorhamnose reductase
MADDLVAMNLLILGAYGMLGHKLFLELGRRCAVVGTCRQPRPEWDTLIPAARLTAGVDAVDFESVAAVVSATRPDAVINCIGVIKQDLAGGQPIPSIRINALFPHLLAEHCRSLGIRLIHFGTDCVFSGGKGNYAVDDFADASDLYGRTKYLGEVGGAGCLTLRSSLIGRELAGRRSLVEWFLGNEGGQVKGFRRAVFSGVTTGEMANVVWHVLSHRPTLSGVWQVAAAPISKYDLLRLIRAGMGLAVEIDADDDFVCDRSLDGAAFAAATGYVLPSWDAMIAALAADTGVYESLRNREWR